MIGKIHPKKTMFLRNNVGSADGPGGFSYEMSSNFSDHSPIIQSKKTGKWFVLGWEEIVNLAIDAGIDKPDRKPRKKKEKKS